MVGSTWSVTGASIHRGDTPTCSRCSWARCSMTRSTAARGGGTSGVDLPSRCAWRTSDAIVLRRRKEDSALVHQPSRQLSSSIASTTIEICEEPSDSAMRRSVAVSAAGSPSPTGGEVPPAAAALATPAATRQFSWRIDWPVCKPEMATGRSTKVGGKGESRCNSCGILVDVSAAICGKIIDKCALPRSRHSATCQSITLVGSRKL
mmetsp:Transcript_16738/g.52310  ORF Transcript_16738/g.52310 Transcript_16738/m.52310 type:complete len:206 (+) Transcript_16738:377-994(+)